MSDYHDGRRVEYAVCHDMGGEDVRLLLRYLIWEWFVRARWFGLRRWIYYRALRAKVRSVTEPTS